MSGQVWTARSRPSPTAASGAVVTHLVVLRELLGREDVKNYDGSWTEYGSLMGAPIELGRHVA
jgi:3-mercaptopyruvate sulfurtransferase SseA